MRKTSRVDRLSAKPDRASERSSTLADEIRFRPSVGRSVNVERDQSAAVLDSYIATGRSIELVRRFVSAIRKPASGRALSLTGPYGCGKSSAAVFLTALMARAKDEHRGTAERLLRVVDPDLLAEVRSARSEIGAGADGFLKAAVTAQREPIAFTIARAIGKSTRAAALAASSRRASKGLLRIAERVEAISRRVARGGPSVGSDLREVVEELASHVPVLLVIDEFGKCLEYAATSAHDGDLFPLQELAECGSGSHPSPVFVLTLQHLAFEDYLAGAPDTRRTEWTKIQGRFQDLPFVDSRQEVWHLIANAFDASHASLRCRESVARWAKAEVEAASAIGLIDLCPSQAVVEAAFPLHPSVLAVLPDLCARVGQHERTLFSFLAGGEPGSVVDLMQSIPADASPSGASVRLHHVYDYFLECVIGSAGASPVVQRWLEIDTRVRDANGLTPAEVKVLKTVGVLNIVSAGGPLRASADLVAYAAADGVGGTANDQTVWAILAELKKRSLVGFRDFAGEYRVWQGTDFDASGAVQAARRRLRNVSTAGLLNRLRPLAPIVAARHSQETGTPRVFERRFVDAASGAVQPPALVSAFDGVVVYAIDPGGIDSQLDVTDRSKPVVIVSARSTERLREAALSVAAVFEIIENVPPPPEDHVARRELRDRLAHASQMLDEAFERTFGVPAGATLWPGGRPFETSRGLSYLVSQVCDSVYQATPRIRNEILNRNELSSQAAQARRQLLEAMLQHWSNPSLGIEGYGPDRAMYEAMLVNTGMHREAQAGQWDLSGPNQEDHLHEAWVVLEDLVDVARKRRLQLSELYEALAAPPVGMRGGPIPVLLAAWLHVHMDDVAVYENGVYQPRITIDLLERLVRTPERFAVKSFAAARGERSVLARLGEALGAVPPRSSRMRNRAILTVVAPLLGRARGLTDYAKRTKRLSPATIAASAALLDAR